MCYCVILERPFLQPVAQQPRAHATQMADSKQIVNKINAASETYKTETYKTFIRLGTRLLDGKYLPPNENDSWTLFVQIILACMHSLKFLVTLSGAYINTLQN